MYTVRLVTNNTRDPSRPGLKDTILPTKTAALKFLRSQSIGSKPTIHKPQPRLYVVQYVTPAKA